MAVYPQFGQWGPGGPWGGAFMSLRSNIRYKFINSIGAKYNENGNRAYNE